MTKNEMRQLLATLVPDAIADGRAYVVRRPAGKAVRELPNDKAQVQTKPVRPMRIFPRQGVMGAGFKVPTHRVFNAANPDDVTFPTNLKPQGTPYFCAACDCTGSNCTC